MSKSLFSSNWIATAGIAVVAALSSTAISAAEFGRLSYGGNPIALTVGTGIGNDGFYMNRTAQSAGELLIGIKAHEYYSGNNPADASTQSSYSGGGSWLDINASGEYVGYAGIAANHPSWNPNAPRWAFTWNVSLNGGRPATGIANMSMVITRPDNVAVDVVPSFDIGAAMSNGEPIWQNSWNLGYLGVFGNGVDANTVGVWKVRISVFDASGNWGSQEISINVVPAPGAIALIGLAGFAKRRRRH